MKTLTLAVLITLLPASAALAEVLQVPSHANPSIQDAIDAAVDGDMIQLAAGVYFERIDLSGKAVTLAGDPAGGSVLDGDGAGPVVTISNGEGRGTLLTNLEIRNGAAVLGGGLEVLNASPTIKNCSIHDCSATGAGGGAAFGGGRPLLAGCTFWKNNAELGGAIAVTSADVELELCVFQLNRATDGGGAIYVADASLWARQSRFQDNEALGDGQEHDDFGGGGLLIRKSDMLLESCSFEHNSGHLGGGIRSIESLNILEAIEFTGNEAVVDGGGMLIDGGDAWCTTSTWSGNTCGLTGGGLDLQNVATELRNCTFSLNQAGLYGGGFATNAGTLAAWDLVATSNSARSGGACMLYDGFTNIQGLEATHNTAEEFGGAVHTAFGLHYLFAGQLRHNSAMTGGGIAHDSSEWDVRGSMIQYNEATLEPVGGIGGGGGIWTTNMPLGKLASTVVCGNVSDQINGAFQDLGLNTIADLCDGDEPSSDIDSDGSVAVGDLLQVIAQWGVCSEHCSADLDLDGLVGINDLLQVIADWGSKG